MSQGPRIIGRSSSHFTRTARMFALELAVDHDFKAIPNLMSSDSSDYAGNPALKLPILETSSGVWFGALNICRELSRRSTLGLRVVWPEDLDQPLPANAQEFTVQAMATEVTLIMAKVAGLPGDDAYHLKMRKSLSNTIVWLDENLPGALAALPPSRDLSFLEVTLFCLVTHLDFREILPTAGHANLTRFCQELGERASAVSTSYRFDT
jgi:glutathione S-transferase